MTVHRFDGEILLSPFERSIVGPQGAVVLRRNRYHAEQCAEAIRRRSHPAWSRFVCGYRVESEAA